VAQEEQKVTLRISAAAAPYVGADKPREAKLAAAAGRVGLAPLDAVVLVYYLCNDPDPEVKRTAQETLKALPLPVLTAVLGDPQLHPRLLDILVKLHHAKPELAPLFTDHPALSEAAAVFLAERGLFSVAVPEDSDADAEPEAADSDSESEADQEADADPEAEPEVPAEEEEEYQSKYQMAQQMGIGDKIKMAMSGDKEWRNLLIKDSNKLVSSAVIKNPRLTEGEVLTIAKSAVQNDDIIRLICGNKEWVKNPLIRKALAENSKTPLPAALRFVATLSEKELALMAKSKNISSVIASQARRILLAKKKGR
jgi:hypothetical protein